MSKQRVFVDSDVVYSSLTSKKGAVYILLQNTKIVRLVSNYSEQELTIVFRRKRFKHDKVRTLIDKKLKLVVLEQTIAELKKQYAFYTHDTDDAHIVAGAVEGKARFLITYNVKDYKIEKIKKDFGIIIYTPALYLQYLRSIGQFT